MRVTLLCCLQIVLVLLKCQKNDMCIQCANAKHLQYVEEFSSAIFKTDGLTLFCNIGYQTVSLNKGLQVTQHLSIAKHLSN